jgi:hypothetical protein
MNAIAEAPDVHAGAKADVLEGAEGLDAGFGVVGGHDGARKKEAEQGAVTSAIPRWDLIAFGKGTLSDKRDQLQLLAFLASAVISVRLAELFRRRN